MERDEEVVRRVSRKSVISINAVTATGGSSMVPITLHSKVLSWLEVALADTDARNPGCIESVLAEFYAQKDGFRQDLRTVSESLFERMLLLSRETSSHFKWHLLTLHDGSANVWLHEYKSSSSRSSGYAQSVHNHRYPMSVLVLAGGYCYTKYGVSFAADKLHADICIRGVQRLSGGSVYSMEPNEYHSATRILDGTVSLMIQGAPDRSYSTSVDLATHKISYHVPIEYRLNSLRSALDTKN
jgi:hypothetical protein